MSTTQHVPYTQLKTDAEYVHEPSSHGRPILLAGSSPARSRSFGDLLVVSGRPSFRPKKGRLIRWLVIDSAGHRQIMVLDKRQVLQVLQLDIPSRDLRLMDSALGTSETVGQLLVRDNALVFSMEYAKMIIKAEKVIIPLDDDKTELKDRFIHLMEGAIRDRLSDLVSSPDSRGANGFEDQANRQDNDVLPFELYVLEAGLGEVCRYLAHEVALLQAQSTPALEDFTKNAETANLERVRRIKTLHQRLMWRVKAVHDALGRLMEDDDDMLRMCLTRQQVRAAAAAQGNSPASSPSAQHTTEPGSMLELATSLRTGLHHMPARRLHAMINKSTEVATVVATSNEFLEYGLVEVENLLESYFLMMDSTLQSLVSIGEYIDDTEDLVNIQLDYSRNKLIRFEILLTTGTFSLAVYSVIAGILGENLVIPDAITQDLKGFLLVNGLSTMLCLCIFCAVVLTLQYKRLL